MDPVLPTAVAREVIDPRSYAAWNPLLDLSLIHI